MHLKDVPHIKVNRVIKEQVADIEPDVVYTHLPHEANLDHESVYDSTLVATRPASEVSRVLAYETLGSETGFEAAEAFSLVYERVNDL